jgi:APA family basic amino acid/polyamine antiporter
LFTVTHEIPYPDKKECDMRKYNATLTFDCAVMIALQGDEMKSGQTSLQNELKRDLGVGSAITLVVANMIGTGIFTTSGFMAWEPLGTPRPCSYAGSWGASWPFAGHSATGSWAPCSLGRGANISFLRESFGKLMGFLSGWISLVVGFSAPIAAAAIAFAAYFFRIFPGRQAQDAHGPLFESAFLDISPITLLAVGVIIFFSIIQGYSLLLGSRVQNLLTGVKIAIILIFIVAGFTAGNGSIGNFSVETPLDSILSTGFAGSLIFVSFAYSGWNAAAYLGSEIKAPERNIPLALFWGTLLVTVLYLLLNTVFIYALPVSKMKGVVEVGAASASALFGGGIERVFSGAITFCLLSVISAMVMAGPRVYYAMAKDRLFFKRFGKVTRRHGTPAHAITLQGGIAVFMVLTASFERLLVYIGFTLSIFALLTVLGMMVMRVKEPHLNRPYRTFGYPITPILFILSNLWIILFSIKSNPMATLCGAGTILCGILAFLYFDRKGIPHCTREPSPACDRLPPTGKRASK